MKKIAGLEIEPQTCKRSNLEDHEISMMFRLNYLYINTEKSYT